MTGEQLAAAFALLVGKQKPAAKPSAASAAAGAAPAAEAEPPRLDIKSIDAAAALLKVPLTPLQLDGILRRMAAPYQDTVDLEYFSKWCDSRSRKPHFALPHFTLISLSLILRLGATAD